MDLQLKTSLEKGEVKIKQENEKTSSEALYSTPRKESNKQKQYEPRIPLTKEERIALEIEALNAYIEEDI